jgi:hypothetical protein
MRDPKKNPRSDLRWSDEELTVVARSDLTNGEAGKLIGRSVGAVRAARRRLSAE